MLARISVHSSVLKSGTSTQMDISLLGKYFISQSRMLWIKLRNSSLVSSLLSRVSLTFTALSFVLFILSTSPCVST